MNGKRIVIFGADGMRPDSFDPNQMPNYARLMQEGTYFPNFMAAYPSHTRVNAATLSTGVRPGKHGLVSNLMYTPEALEPLLDTSKAQQLLDYQKASAGPLLLVEGLGDQLAARGERLAVASAGSSGSALLWNPNHRERILNPNWHFDEAELIAVHEKLAEPAKEKGRSKLEACRWITEAMIDCLLDDEQNRVITLWLSEPDSSQHFYGLGSPEAKEALRCVDECLGKLLDALEARGLEEDVELLIISDHGHATVKAGISLSDILNRATAELGLKASYVPVLDFVYAKPDMQPETEDLARLATWLKAQAWCDEVYAPRALGLKSTRALEELIGPILHQRAPLLAINPRSTAEANAFGVKGITESLSPYGMLKSSHGSLSQFEMNAFCLAVGESFASGDLDERACTTSDIAPTIAELLGLEAGKMDGQSLVKKGLSHE